MGLSGNPYIVPEYPELNIKGKKSLASCPSKKSNIGDWFVLYLIGQNIEEDLFSGFLEDLGIQSRIKDESQSSLED